MIWIALAAQSVAPSPINLSKWLVPDDVPVHAIRPEVMHVVGIALTIAPQGRIEACAIEITSNNSGLDALTCRLVRQRARFRPAQDGLAPVYGVYRTTLKWWTGDGDPPAMPVVADLDLTLSALPSKVKSPAEVRLMLRVDEAGRASNCAAEDKESDPTLVQLGCQELVKAYRATPATNREGAPVVSIQTATVQFRTD